MRLRFEPITFGPFELVDANTLPERERTLALAAGGRNLVAFLAASGHGPFCDSEIVTRRRDEEWSRLRREKRPRRRREFLDSFDPQLGDAEHDQRLGFVRFALRRGAARPGLFFLYNVEPAEGVESAGLLRATAYPAPGHEHRGDDAEFARPLGRFFRGFLERDLPLVGGGVFRLVAWKFPTEVVGRRWIRPELSTGFHPPMAAEFDALVAAGFVRTDRNGTIAALARPPRESA